MNGRVVRISGAGCSQDRRPAGDQRICHHHLGSGRRRFTIEKVSHSSETGELYDGCVDLATREAPASGPSSLWQALSGRAAMWRQSFLVIHLVFRKMQKTDRRSFLCRVRVSEHLCDSWNANKWKEQHGYDCSYALARESPPVTLREGALKKGSWLVQGFACTFVCNSAGSGPSDPMSALEGAPGCVGAVRGDCAIFSYFH